jgi:hypothetical protein
MFLGAPKSHTSLSETEVILHLDLGPGQLSRHMFTTITVPLQIETKVRSKT